MGQRIGVNRSGHCPHCGKGIQFLKSSKGQQLLVIGNSTLLIDASDGPAGWLKNPDDPKQAMEIISVDCPLCKRPIVAFQIYKIGPPAQISQTIEHCDTRLIWPRISARKPLPANVPPHIAEDYREAALVLADSEKASAALSRRCLQSLLKDAAHTKSKDLADQIDEILPMLPGYLRTDVDAIRNIGNFAAHPQKSKATGEIIAVEKGEAEWNLDVLDMLFDFYYARPLVSQEKRDSLNAKLVAAGKPPMK